MFGFLHGPSDDRYRAIYATICSTMRDRVGYRALPLVSYEAIFLSCLAIDSGLCESPPLDTPRCCKTRRRFSASSDRVDEDLREVVEFAVHFAILLAAIKLRDDVVDQRSVVARASLFALRNAIRESGRYFGSLDVKYMERVDGFLESHAMLEKRLIFDAAPVSLPEYCVPTSDAFGYVFSLLPQKMSRHVRHSSLSSLFESMGRKIGRALIAFDCAVDLRFDRRRKLPNPLNDDLQVIDALAYSQQALVSSLWEVNSLTQGDLAARVLTHRLKTISRRRRELEQPCGHSSENEMSRHRPRFLRKKRAAFCDCDCGGCDCDCGGCHGGVEECVRLDGCTQVWPECCGQVCCDPGEKKGSRAGDSKATEATQTPSQHSKIGAEGMVVVPLTPYGMVRLDGEPAERGKEHPAKSTGLPIEVGARVRVVKSESFGLVVQEIVGDSSVEEKNGDETLLD